MLKSIWEQIQSLYPPSDRLDTLDFPVKETDHIKRAYTSSSMLRSRLRRLSTSGKPLLILIDGIDQLEEEESEEFLKMEWADGILSPSVKMIITSTDDYEFDFHTERIKGWNLSSPQIVDAWTIVNGLLSIHNRRLQQAQINEVNIALSKSDKLPLYLSLLAHSLCCVSSFENIQSIPSDLDSLVRSIFDRIISVKRHDSMFVEAVFSLFAIDRQGFAQTELLELLSSDPELKNKLKERSFHEWNMEGKSQIIPLIYWTRLYSDASFFFRFKDGKCGKLLYIYHSAVIKAIKNIYLKDSASQLWAYMLLANFYKKMSSPHAYMEAIYSRYLVFVNLYNNIKNGGGSDLEMLKLILNPKFLYHKLNLDRNDLIKDFELIRVMTRTTQGNTIDIIQNLKNDVLSLKASDWDGFVAQCMNMHSESVIRQLISLEKKDFCEIMNDSFRDSYPYGKVVCSSSGSGVVVMLSDDGTKLLSLFQKNHKILVEDMNNNTNNISYTIPTPIVALSATLDLRIHAFITKTGLTIYDSITRKLLDNNNEIQNAIWVSISTDGKVYAYGNKDSVWVSTMGLLDIGAYSGQLNKTGDYLWLASIDRPMLLNTFTNNAIYVNADKLYDTNDTPIAIVASSEDKCILHNGRTLFFFSAYEDNGDKKCLMLPVYFPTGESMKWQGSVCNNGFSAIANTGQYIIVEKEKDGDLVIKEITNTNGVSVTSHNFKYVYSSIDWCCYNLSEYLNVFKVRSEFNLGVNTLASSNSGNLIAVSSGKNIIQEISKEILIAKNGKILERVDFTNLQKQFLSTCAVSPIGNEIWVSAESGNIFILDYCCNVSKLINNTLNVIDISFTSDSNFIVICFGDYLANGDPLVGIYNSAGDLVRTFTVGSFSDFSFNGHVILSESNRYIIYEGIVIDLIDERIVYNGARIQQESMVFRTKFDVNPHYLYAIDFMENIIFGNFQLFDIHADKFIEGEDSNLRVIACTRNGFFLFCLDQNRYLYLVDPKGNETNIEKNVNTVLPTFNERYVYIVFTDGSISFYDIFTKRTLQKAFFSGCSHYKITFKGLTAVSGDGKLCLFEPDEKYGLKDLSTVIMIKRWNLATCKQDEIPTVVCPSCGRAHKAPQRIVNFVYKLQAIKQVDWDNKILFESCPFCNARLKYGAFILE